MKVEKELVLFPLGNYKSVRIIAKDCDSWDEANKTLLDEYKRYRDLLSDADKERYDIILNK